MSDSNTPNTDLNLQVLKYGNHEVLVGDIAEAGLRYLLQYGFAQSLQDSVAGFAKAYKAEHPEADAAAVTKAVNAKMAERVAAIVAGSVGTRVGGPKLSGIEKIMRDVARDRIKAAVVAKNAKAPKDKQVAMPKGEALSDMVEKLIAAKGDEIRAEAQAHLDKIKAAAEGVDIDTLMAAD